MEIDLSARDLEVIDAALANQSRLLGEQITAHQASVDKPTETGLGVLAATVAARSRVDAARERIARYFEVDPRG